MESQPKTETKKTPFMILMTPARIRKVKIGRVDNFLYLVEHEADENLRFEVGQRRSTWTVTRCSQSPDGIWFSEEEYKQPFKTKTAAIAWAAYEWGRINTRKLRGRRLRTP